MSKIEFVCAFCIATCNIAVSDLDHEAFECPSCGSENYIPDTLEQLEANNRETLERGAELSTPTHYRVMLQGEDGTEACLKNGVPAEWAQLVADGLAVGYPDGRVFMEPEMSVMDIMCDDRHLGDYEL